MATSSIGGPALKQAFSAGVESLSQKVELINQLNVFPVPDGDTGINMFHTLRRAYREIEPIDSDDASYIAERFAYGALMGARGNSGAILSQLLKGFADGLGKASNVTPERFAGACQAAVQQGYASVSTPTEGTILTVAREAAEALQRSDREPMTLRQMLQTLTAAAQASLSRTPDLLPILRDAGVVDAGGMGLLCFLKGMQMEPLEPRPGSAQMKSSLPAPAIQAEAYGYDVQFLMLGAGLDITQARRDLEQLGWSVLVLGDSETIKVHIHVDNPAIPLDYAIQAGASLADVVVENMDRQVQERMAVGPPRQDQPDIAAQNVSVIAVLEGDGLRAIFEDLGCGAIISGGAGANPATEDFLAAIDHAPAELVIILPNDRNIALAAQQAVPLAAGRQVHIVATQTILQGISAMLAFGDAIDAGADFDTMAAQMTRASAEVHSIEITRASRSTRFRDLDIKQNDYIAVVDGMIRSASPDIESVAVEAMAAAEAAGLELATLYYGAGASKSESDQLIRRLRKSFKGLEFEAVYGGQSLYPFLISVE